MTTMGTTRLAALLGMAALAAACGGEPDGVVRSAGAADEIEVKLCDNHTTTKVAAGSATTRDDGQRIADALMSQWKREHPEADWVEKEREQHQVKPPADNTALIGKGQGSAYGQISGRDVETWQRETLAMAVHGSTVFHDAGKLGSTIAVSCDMCHPNAANTHPETYPKFQMQLGRVALLRDMINWCIEHPVRGTPLAPDDPKMRALEAYILAQRQGAPLAYGKR